MSENENFSRLCLFIGGSRDGARLRIGDRERHWKMLDPASYRASIDPEAPQEDVSYTTYRRERLRITRVHHQIDPLYDEFHLFVDEDMTMTEAIDRLIEAYPKETYE